MENNTHSGLFPALLELARTAAKELLKQGNESRTIETDDGLWVVRKSDYDPKDGQNIHEFEEGGDFFVIFEPY